MTDPASPELRVTLLQRAAALDPAVNRTALGELAEVAAESDLVVWPEVFARDFGTPGSALGAYAEPLDGPFVTALQRLSEQHGVAALAGMFETSTDPDRPWNTLVLTQPGTGVDLTSYRKIHLYDSFGYRESDVMSAGEISPVVVDLLGWRMGLMTCYDLRFPELARALVAAGAEVIVIPAAWVAGPRKVDHWRALAIARAIENTAYVVAVGQPAPRYAGHSIAIAPNGDVLAECGDGEDRASVTLDRELLEETRRTNPSLRNRRM